MKLIQVLKRESPLLVAREALWRAHREWNKIRLPRRLERPASVKFRCIPYYSPNLRRLSGRIRTLIVAFADEIRAGRYPFLGYGTAQLGTRPKWNVDFVSGADWPRQKCENRECMRHDGSDVKVPYELSRLQFLPILSKAHVLTGDDSYRSAAKDLLSHWIVFNPAPIGVNWSLAMEAALRGMSICFLLNLLSPFRSDEEPWLRDATASLAQHLLYIEAHLEFSHFYTSNHHLSNLVGLYCLSLFLDGEGMAAKRQKYRLKVEAEMEKQVYEDGGDYEASTGYQVLVTQLFTTALLLMRAEGSVPVAAFIERLRKMFRFLNALASASGELPQVGDCDDGRIEFLSDDLEQMLLLPVAERNSLRVSNLLGLGRQIFGEGKGDADDAAWYGLTSVPPFPDSKLRGVSESTRSTLVFPNSGVGVLHSGSSELLLFAIPNGIHGKGSHTHNDKLSFVLRVGGQEILCDSGTACYTRDMDKRNQFRRTAAHNTLQIDGAEQNRIPPGPLGLFLLGNEAAVSPAQEGTDAHGHFLRASHMGYRPLGVVHTRTARTAEGQFGFVIEDELDGHGVHDFELYFQLAPNRTAEVTPIENAVSCRISGDRQIQLTVSAPAQLQCEIAASLVSTAFGATVPAAKIRIWGKAAIPLRITTQIALPVGTDSLSVERSHSEPISA